MPITDSQTISLRPDVIATVLENGAALLDLETKFFYSLNSSGWAIVQLYELGASVEMVVEQCRRQGAVNESNIRDYNHFLVDERLLVPSEEEPGAASIDWEGSWIDPQIEKNQEPLQRLISSAFDPTMPLAE